MPQFDNISQWVNDMVAETQMFDAATSDQTLQYLWRNREPNSRVRFNEVSGGAKGDAAEVLVSLTNRPGSSVSVAGQYTMSAATQHATGDFQNPIFEFVVYYNYVALDHVQESRIIAAMNSQPSKGYNLMQNEVAAMFSGLYQDIEDDLDSANVHSATAAMGVWYPLSTSNSPGGLSQSTFTGWASNVTTATGSSFAVTYLYDAILAAKRRSVMRGVETPDLAILDNTAGARLFRALVDAEDAGERTMTNDEFARVGRMAINVLGAWCFDDTTPSSGSIGVFNTSTWRFISPTVPTPYNGGEPEVSGLTKKYTYTDDCSMLIGDPGRNAIVNGLVAT